MPDSFGRFAGLVLSYDGHGRVVPQLSLTAPGNLVLV